MTKITLTHDYDAPARAVWTVCTDFAALAEVCRPLITFDGLPDGRVRAGQAIEVGVRLFGWLPRQTYRMEVLTCDEHEMFLRSHEFGAGVRQWDHALRVIPQGERGARVTETIDIDAGLMTPAFRFWATTLYSHRHKGRTRLLVARSA
ncbi:SRPBCC family protein [Jannaschia sp. M317]|uniref:SRPBCC family protein n=1 Tax=Jannaschia sp. M317 TaxID=2867011 RepID=UPI0021A33DAF|nr:SRPBCC family protein [Jannaschia sp. M317]UWQ16944.1 SRPBCC family protein [Jannaschia sp. M317]